ncbi:hypothetical protein M3Y97_00651400 [Aphelenchoides bicaudatus]|nr:hypothetical protein M3Y97_00651400 [Aphelenchoides bicaudatus]
MGGSYSLLSTSDDNDVLSTTLANDRLTSRPDCTLQIREPVHCGSINALATVQNDIVISAGSDKQIVVQDLDAGGFITKFSGHEKEITKLIYKHVNDNDFVLSGSLDGTIKLWQFGVPSPIGVFKAEGMKVSGLAAASDTVMISGSTDERLRLWDVNTEKALRCVRMLDNNVTHIAMSPVHTIFAQTSTDKTLKIWDTRSLELAFKSIPKAFPLLHCDIRDGMYCITSSDGNHNEGCEVTLWDLRMQRPVHNFCGNDSPVRSAIFLPQQVTWKKLIASVSEDYRVFVWDKDQGICVWQENLTNLAGYGRLNCCTGFTDGGKTCNWWLGRLFVHNEVVQQSRETISIFSIDTSQFLSVATSRARSRSNGTQLVHDNVFWSVLNQREATRTFLYLLPFHIVHRYSINKMAQTKTDFINVVSEVPISVKEDSLKKYSQLLTTEYEESEQEVAGVTHKTYPAQRKSQNDEEVVDYNEESNPAEYDDGDADPSLNYNYDDADESAIAEIRSQAFLPSTQSRKRRLSYNEEDEQSETEAEFMENRK